MSENNLVGGTRMEAAANSAVMTMLARGGIVLMLTTALPAGAWLGSRAINTLDQIVAKLGVLEVKVERMGVDIDYLKRDVERDR